MKARGLGFSEMNASLAANMYTVRDNSTTLIAANLQKYVDDTISKVWSALSFLNDKTDDGFSQLSQVVNNSMMRKASYIENRNGMKIEAGSMSLIKGIVADSPNKIRGDRCDLLLYEEGGSWVNSTKAFIQGDALIHIQGE
nr:MAG TPA: Terminase large subunit [Caudoviricetes sp.]